VQPRPGILQLAVVEAGDMAQEALPAGGTATAVKTIVRDEPKIGRNDPCPCGSGKKYKKCCGA
jgi:uncharacterized protein YecA (UPF0149 family)